MVEIKFINVLKALNFVFKNIKITNNCIDVRVFVGYAAFENFQIVFLKVEYFFSI